MSPDLLLWLMLALGTVAIGLVILIIMEQGKEKTAPKAKVKLRRVQPVSTLPQPIKKTVTNDIMNEARDKLRLLDLEREILSYAVRRLYEASAEGKISEAERDRLALKYKMDLARINEDIERGESIVALNELERMQEELVNLFSERFDEMNKKIDDLKLRSGLVTSPPNETIILETVKRQSQTEQPPEKEEPREESVVEEKAEDQKQPADKTVEPKTKKASKPKPPAEPETGEAEKKVEEIVAEVEKVLKKLGQMEVEE